MPRIIQVMHRELEIIVIDRGYPKSYDAFMNGADKKTIEELLAKQTEIFSRAMDERFQEQEKRLDLRFQEQEERFEKRMDMRFQEQEERLNLRFQEQEKRLDLRFQEQEERLDLRFQEQEERLDLRFQEQEKRLDLRFQEQEAWFEKRMVHVFNEGFEQVVLPHIVAMKEDIEELRSFQSRMERKLDSVIDRQDRQGEEIEKIKKFIQMPEGA